MCPLQMRERNSRVRAWDLRAGNQPAEARLKSWPFDLQSCALVPFTFTEVKLSVSPEPPAGLRQIKGHCKIFSTLCFNYFKKRNHTKKIIMGYCLASGAWLLLGTIYQAHQLTPWLKQKVTWTPYLHVHSEKTFVQFHPFQDHSDNWVPKRRLHLPLLAIRIWKPPPPA